MSEAAQETVTQTAPVQSAPAEQSGQSSGFQVPQEYSDRGWAKDIKSPDDLWKLTDNAQSLIGKRPAGIPTSGAPQEEWEKFYTALGRPESPDAYELKTEVEGLPEGFDAAPYEGKAKAFFHKLGLSPEKANQAWNDYLAMELEGVQEMQTQSAEQKKVLDAEFDKLRQDLWGDNYEQVSTQAQDFIKSALPDELKPVVNEIAESPKALAAMIKLAEHAQSQIKETKAKYGAEDKLTSGEQSAGMSQQEVVNQMMEQRKIASTAEPFSAERKTAEIELENLRKKLASFNK